MQNEVKQLKDSLEEWKSTTSARLVAPSVTSPTQFTNHGTAVSIPPNGVKKKLFFEILTGKNAERHRLTVKPQDNKSTEEIKNLLRAKIDPVNMKIGIRAFQSLKNGNVLIEVDSKEEIEILDTQSCDKCRDQLETNVQKRKSRTNYIQCTRRSDTRKCGGHNTSSEPRSQIARRGYPN
jgi:hypothetical protein